MEAVQREEEREFHLKRTKEPLFSSILIKWEVEHTSWDGFEFRQLLGKSGQTRLVQDDLLHDGVQQGEAPVPPPQLGQLRRGKMAE